MSGKFDPPSQAGRIVDANSRTTPPWWTWFTKLSTALNPGIDATVVLAKITGGGANGSLTVKNGIITSYTAPT